MKTMQIHDPFCLMFIYSMCMSGVCVGGGDG